MFVESVKVWKSEYYSVTIPPHYATIKDMSKRKRGVIE
jgi:hypothetical protein